MFAVSLSCENHLKVNKNTVFLALYLESFKTLRGKLEVLGKHSKNNLFWGRFSPRGCLKSVNSFMVEIKGED